MRKPTSRLEVGWFFVSADSAVATSYGDDHHHCAVWIAVLDSLIGLSFLLAELAQVKAGSGPRGHSFTPSGPSTGHPWVGKPRSTPR